MQQPTSVRSTSWHARLRQLAPELVARGDVRFLVIAVGLATFVCGFLAGALLNLYLVGTHHPVVYQLRTALTYRSAILGDGLLLPLVNMAAASYLARQRRHVGRATVFAAVLLGAAITAYFHILQATNQLVNWAMPTPWQWNGLGVWHALYMLAVTSLLMLFLFIVVKVIREASTLAQGTIIPAGATFPVEAGIVLLGVLIFLVLLRLDYRAVDLQWLPRLR